MADGALRCFASLADRFIRRSVDPAPLAQHGLIQDLLQRLASAGCNVLPGSTPASSGNNYSCEYNCKTRYRSPFYAGILMVIS